MIDILGFFKKQPLPEPITETDAEPVKEEQVQVDNIAIHVMPERFRRHLGKAQSAKTTGLIIIAGGMVFLIVISILLYFYLFKKPQAAIITEMPAGETAAQPEVSQPGSGAGIAPVEQATTTETSTLPLDSASATFTATTTQEVIEQEINLGLKLGLDSDFDGLNDLEEVIFGTGTSTPDTDADSFPDGGEVYNLYNPAGAGKLGLNPSIALYENKTFGYSAFHPKIWQPSINGGDDSVMFKTADNQFVQIIVQPNPDKQPLDQWYLEQLGAASIREADRVSGANWQGIKNADGLTLYLADAKLNYIFTLTYNLGESNILEYVNIFQMMIKSFTIKN